MSDKYLLVLLVLGVIGQLTKIGVVLLIWKKCNIRYKIHYWFINCVLINNIIGYSFYNIETILYIFEHRIPLDQYFCKIFTFISHCSDFLCVVLWITIIIGYVMLEQIEEKHFKIMTAIASSISVVLTSATFFNYTVVHVENDNIYFCDSLLELFDWYEHRSYSYISLSLLIVTIGFYYIMMKFEAYRTNVMNKPEYKIILKFILFFTFVIRPLSFLLSFLEYHISNAIIVSSLSFFYKPILLYICDEDLRFQAKKTCKKIFSIRREGNIAFENPMN